MSWLDWYVAALILFLLSPIILVIPVSFNSGPSFNFPPLGFSFRWYDNLFHTPSFLRAFLLSCQVTIAATATSLVVGSMAAYAGVRYEFPGRRAFASLALSPLIFPQIVLGAAMIIFLSGIGMLRTTSGLIVANIVVTLPYVIRNLTAAFQNLDPAVEEVAMVLGANRFQVLWKVVLPNVRTALVSAGVLAGLVSFDEFTIALFITGGDLVTLPVQIFQSTYFGVDPTVAALGTLLIVFSGAIIFGMERLIGFERFFGVPAVAGDRDG